MRPQRLPDSSNVTFGPVFNPRSMATPGNQHGLSLPQRSSEQLSGVVICGPLDGGVPSAVCVLCNHRNSRTLWGGESAGYRRASHTILFLYSMRKFSTHAALHHPRIKPGSRRRQRYIRSLDPGCLCTFFATKPDVLRKMWGMPRRVADVSILNVSLELDTEMDKTSTFMRCRDPGSNRETADLQSDALPVDLSLHGRSRAK